MFQILVRAASCGATIEQTSKELKNSPSSNTIRYHLNKIEDFKQLETEINVALKSQIPKGLKKKKQTLALDINLIPYYGQPSPEERPYILIQVKLKMALVLSMLTLLSMLLKMEKELL